MTLSPDPHFLNAGIMHLNTAKDKIRDLQKTTHPHTKLRYRCSLIIPTNNDISQNNSEQKIKLGDALFVLADTGDNNLNSEEINTTLIVHYYSI